MQGKLKKWILQLLKMPLGVALLIVFCVLSGYGMITDVYHQFKYNFPNILHTFYFWSIVGATVLAISWGWYFIDYLKNKNK